MPDVFLEVFAGAADDPPPSSTKLEGGIGVWELTGGGRCRVDDAARTALVFQRYASFPGRSDWGLQLKAQFSNPASSGRGVQLCWDVTDADNYLFLEFRSGGGGAPWDAVGKPEVALGKVVGGVETLLHGPVSVNGGVALTADTLYMIEVVRAYDPATDSVDYEVRFEASWLTAPRPLALFSYNDGGNLTHENGQVGWRNTIGTHGSELEIDDLRVFELVDAEADAGDDFLTVGGETLTRSQMRDRKISPRDMGVGYPAGEDFVFEERVRWQDASFQNEQLVTLKWDGAVRFRGFIHKRTMGTTPGNESVLYHCYGRRARLRFVTPTHPTTGAHRLIWNGDLDDYLNAADAAQFGYPVRKTYGEIVGWYRTTFAPDLRRVGAAKPQNVDAFVQADLDALTMTPLRTELRGDFPAHVEGLLSRLRAYALKHNAETDLWRIFKVSALPAVALDETNDKLVQSSLSEDSTGIRTKVCIVSVRRETVDAQAKDSDGTLSDYWDAAHQAVYTPDKAKRSSITATITAVNLGAGPGGEDEIDVDYDNPPRTYPSEWLDGQLVVTSGAASGEIHGMLVQGAGATAPYGGTIRLDGNFTGVPVVTDTIRLEETGEPEGVNRFKNVFRRFRITDPGKGEILRKEDGGCPKLTMKVPEVSAGELSTAAKSEQVLGIGIVGPGRLNLVSKIPVTNPYSKLGASAICHEEGSYQKPEEIVLDYQYLETTVLQVCKPASGYVDPGYPDPIERTLMIEEPEWRDSSQASIVGERAQEILDVVSQKQWTGKPTLLGLHWDFAQLGVSLALASTSRTMPTAGVYVLPIAVRYRFASTSKGDQTVLDLGGTASFVESGAKFRAKLEEQTTLERLKEAERRMREFASCSGSGEPEAPDPASLNPICASKIRTGISTTSPPTKTPPGPGKELEVVIEWILENKWKLDNSMDGVLHNLGKTTDDETGEVLEPGTLVGPNGATHHRPDGTTTPLAENDTVPETEAGKADNERDGILHNLGKTTDSEGNVLPSGSPAPAGGGTHHGPGGTETPIPGGNTVPETEIDRLKANKALLEKGGFGQDPDPQDGSNDPDGLLQGTIVKSGTSDRLKITPDGATVEVGSSIGIDGVRLGGALGVALGKCASTMGGHGDPEHARGWGVLQKPGELVDVEGAVYYPPTQDNRQQPTAIVLSAAHVVPSSTLDMLTELVRQTYGVTVTSLNDPAGVVWDG